MGRQASEAKRLEWEDRLQRQAASGLSVSAFCRRDSVSEASFYYWKRKLKKDHRPRTAPRPGHRASTDPETPQFVRLPAGLPLGPSCVEITAANGTVIRVPAERVAALQIVFQALAGVGPAAAEGDLDA